MDPFALSDELGPGKIVFVHEKSVGLKGILVVDNTACGPAIGGLRMAPDVSLEECFRLARAMTLKNASAGLPHGGGKSVLFGDPGMDIREKEKLIRAMAAALRDVRGYIFGPDMGTNEQCMAWVHDEIGRSVGLPAPLGGIPLDEFGATGFGLMHALEIAAASRGKKLEGLRIAVQGFGAVGKHAARFLAGRGAKIVAVSDTKGGVLNADGLDVDALWKLKADGRSVTTLPGGKSISGEELIAVDCDVWIPAARPDVIHESNVQNLKADIVVSGANIPLTAGAELSLEKRGVLCIPDFIANAGGVICAAMEYAGQTKTAAFQTIEEKIRSNTERIIEDSKKSGISPRDAGLRMAIERIRQAMNSRRFRTF